MSTREASAPAGGFARDRFRVRRTAWRRRVWWVFPLLALLPLAIELPIVWLTNGRHQELVIGIAIGAGIAAAWVLFDSPPEHVERWRRGADGERATARAVRPLLKRGWVLFNDIDTGRGNIDHVLVGPAGVFMLESKRLGGSVCVESGKLIVRWHEDPNDGYENESIARRARGAAFELHSRIAALGGSAWVQPAIVMWSDFAQRSIEYDRIAWVHGGALSEVLAARPTRYEGDALRLLVRQTADAVSELRQPPSGGVQGRLSNASQ